MSPAPPRAFISYSHDSADHDERVRALADRLCGDGVDCTIDQYDPHPREPWPRWMERQIEEADFVLVVCTETYLRRARGLEPPGVGLGVTFESVLIIQDLYDAGMWNEKFIPILFDGASPQSIPKPLRGYTRYKLDADYESLLRHVRNEPRVRKPEVRPGVPLPPADSPKLPSQYRCMAQPPEGWVHRREYDEVREALCSKEGAQTGRSVGITTALRGAGGFGKTALAQKLCFDDRVRETYPDGILWATMGEEIDSNGRLRQIRDLLRWWDQEEPPAFETVAAAGAKLRESLNGARALVVVDDVWRPEDVAPFQGLGESCALLITTRDSRTLPADSKHIKVDAMASAEAVDLLQAGLSSSSPEDFKSLAAHLGEWPLLLKLVNGPLREMVNEGLSISEALQEIEGALATEGFSAFDQSDSASRHAAASRAILVSVRRLPEAEQEFFFQLAIFPEDEDIPVSVLERYWGLSHFGAARICQHLYDLSLLLKLDRKNGTIRLHDVTRRVLMEQRAGELSSLHFRLLETYGPASGRWEDLPREESYLWRRLRDHFIGSGGRHEFKALLTRFSFIEAKLLATDVNSVIGDYEPFVGEDQELRLIQAALRLSAHVLANDRNQLASQLLGRLLSREELGLQALLGEARSWRESVWLRPRTGGLTQAGGTLVRTLEGHTAGVNAVAVLDGGRAVSSSDDGTLRVWDLESGQTLRTLEGRTGRITAMAVWPDGCAVSSSRDGTLRVWDLESGQILHAFGGHHNVTRLTAVGDRHFISQYFNGPIRMWDRENGQILNIFGYKDYAILDSWRAISSVTSTVEGEKHREIRIWDFWNGGTLQVLKGYSGLIKAMEAIDSRRVIFVAPDQTIRIWNLESDEILQILNGHKEMVTAIAVVDDMHVVSASVDQTLRVWSLESGQTIQILNGHTDAVTAVAVAGNRRIVSGSYDGILRIWNLEKEMTDQPLARHTNRVTTLAVVDNQYAVSGSYDGTLRVWDLKTGQILRNMETNKAWITSVATVDSVHVVSGSFDGTLWVLNIKTGQPLQVLGGHAAGITTVATFGSWHAISGSAGEGALWVWDLQSGKRLRSFNMHSDWVRAVALIDGQRAVSCSDDGTLQMWDIETGKVLQIFKGHAGSVRAVAVVDIQCVISGSDDGTLRVWNLETGQTQRILEGHLAKVTAVASIDGRLVTSTSLDRTLRVWDIESGKMLALMTFDAPVWALAVTHEKVIMAGDQAGEIHFFELVMPE